MYPPGDPGGSKIHTVLLLLFDDLDDLQAPIVAAMGADAMGKFGLMAARTLAHGHLRQALVSPMVALLPSRSTIPRDAQ